jgi:hypothetical protein
MALMEFTSTPHRFRLSAGGWLLLVAIVAAAVGLYHIVNPTGLNHIVIMNMSGRDLANGPITIELSEAGDASWKHIVAQGGLRTADPDRGGLFARAEADLVEKHSMWQEISHTPLRVHDTGRHAFFRGTLTITDGDQVEVAKLSLEPPGRYCGTLVIVLLPDRAIHAYNHVPLPPAEE